MEIKTITQARLFNLGNYENERLEIVASLYEEEDLAEAAVSLSHLIEAQHDAILRDREERAVAARQAAQERLRAETPPGVVMTARTNDDTDQF